MIDENGQRFVIPADIIISIGFDTSNIGTHLFSIARTEAQSFFRINYLRLIQGFKKTSTTWSNKLWPNTF